MQEMQVQPLGQEGMATHSRILAWRIPWTKLDRLQCIRSQGVRHNWAPTRTNAMCLTRQVWPSPISLASFPAPFSQNLYHFGLCCSSQAALSFHRLLKHAVSFAQHVFFFFLTFIYLAAPGLSCSMWDLVPWPGMEPKLPALGVQSLSHWTIREVPSTASYILF